VETPRRVATPGRDRLQLMFFSLYGPTKEAAEKLLLLKGTGFSPYVLGSKLTWALAPEAVLRVSNFSMNFRDRTLARPVVPHPSQKTRRMGHPNGCCPQNTYETPINGEGLKCRPASFKRKRTLPVTSSLATGLTLAPNEMFAWFTLELKVVTFD
jgi:hypothetical protein